MLISTSLSSYLPQECRASDLLTSQQLPHQINDVWLHIGLCVRVMQSVSRIYIMADCSLVHKLL